jgi:hypothetical protein
MRYHRYRLNRIAPGEEKFFAVSQLRARSIKECARSYAKRSGRNITAKLVDDGVWVLSMEGKG